MEPARDLGPQSSTTEQLHKRARDEMKKLYAQMRRVIKAQAKFEEAYVAEIEALGIPFDKQEKS